MMKSYKGIISYDGTRYLGWQKTKEGASIQESLEQALFKITGEKGPIEAASRTDRGVHAEGQVIQFRSAGKNLLRAFNALLPPDIRLIQLEEKEFHPTLDAALKEYRYRLCLSPVQEPIYRLYSWHCHTPLNLNRMKQAAQDFLGTHDFTAFANEPEKNTVCTIEKIEFTEPSLGRLQIAISGNRFLYKMVRNITGTLLYIGCGKLPENSIPFLLASRDRKLAGVTAPAHGLFLHKVHYDRMVL